jgi:hypothetical protein
MNKLTTPFRHLPEGRFAGEEMKEIENDSTSTSPFPVSAPGWSAASPI